MLARHLTADFAIIIIAYSKQYTGFLIREKYNTFSFVMFTGLSSAVLFSYPVAPSQKLFASSLPFIAQRKGYGRTPRLY